MKLGRCENCDTLREMLESSEKRYAGLMQNYHDLRTLGANAAAVGLQPVKRNAKPADEAIEAVCEQYPHFIGLRKKLQRFVNMERQKPNADEAVIATMVREWPSDEEGD
jgi:hypothetical protein